MQTSKLFLYRPIWLVLIFTFQCLEGFGQGSSEQLLFDEITDNFFLYTTFQPYEDQQLPAHGMYVVTDTGIVLFDTPWDTTQFQPLLDSLWIRHHKKVIFCLATHWHDDRTAGLDYYKNLGIPTYTTRLTDSLCALYGKGRAENLIEKDTICRFGAYTFDVFYPGEGHTPDNIVVWFEKEKLLYGGCLIKGSKAKDLGYLGDANLSTYYQTLLQVKQKCANPAYVVVSHSRLDNRKAIKNSLRLAKKLESHTSQL